MKKKGISGDAIISRVSIPGDWESAIGRALAKPRPAEGWPEKPKRAAKKKAKKASKRRVKK